MKICNTCNIEKPLEDFYIKKDGKDGRTPRCKQCGQQKQREAKLKKDPNYKPKNFQEKIDQRFKNEEELKNELLTILGYDLNSELSVHQQFLLRHNFED